MMTKKYTFDSVPSLVENEGKTILVRFVEEERKVEVDGKEMTVYDGYSIRINQPVSRDKVIDAIVSEAYPTDKMQAIINNHFANLAKIADGKKLDADDEEHEAEYNAMQDWRTKAKAVAKDVLEEYIRTH